MRLGSQEIQYLNAFQTIARTTAKDCLIGAGTITFLVKEGEMGLIIGRNGTNVKKLRQALQKSVALFEHKKTVEEFISNAFRDIVFSGFETEERNEKKVLIVKTNNENKKKLLNDLRKMKSLKELVKRNYAINDIRIGK